MTETNWVGLDIGGANIKCSESTIGGGSGAATSTSFPLWERKQDLSPELAKILSPFPEQPLAVTMTGELADCFTSKKEGVAFIVDAVCHSAANRPIVFYQLGGGFVGHRKAKSEWSMTAAANWHAIASFSARLLERGTGFLIDLGSTTCDVIPIEAGNVACGVPDDWKRMQSGLLTYAGVSRTPLCSLIDRVEVDGHSSPVAREWFATTRDVFLYSGDVMENADDRNTADGRPATRIDAIRRLAKCFCADADVDTRWIDALASQTRSRLEELILASIDRCQLEYPNLPPEFILAGEGSWFVKQLLESRLEDVQTIAWHSRFCSSVSDCAAAYSVACLASEWGGESGAFQFE